MTKTTFTQPTALNHYDFDDAMLLEIGRLIRGCAELEDALTMFIKSLAKTGELTVRLLLGKTPFSVRKRTAAQFVRDADDVVATKVLAIFDHEYLALAHTTRNAVAHGVLLGQMPHDGALVFHTDRQDKEPLDFAMVICIQPEDIPIAAKNVGNALNLLEPYLKLKALRETRRSRPHYPLPKAPGNN